MLAHWGETTAGTAATHPWGRDVGNRLRVIFTESLKHLEHLRVAAVSLLISEQRCGLDGTQQVCKGPHRDGVDRLKHFALSLAQRGNSRSVS